MNNKPVYWENTEDGHSKFWAASIIEKAEQTNVPNSGDTKYIYILVRKWGKIGIKPQTMEQKFDNKNDAETMLNELIYDKESKGYKPVF